MGQKRAAGNPSTREAASGVKGENSVKLYGNDLESIQKTAYEIKQVMKTVPGITDLSVFAAARVWRSLR